MSILVLIQFLSALGMTLLAAYFWRRASSFEVYVFALFTLCVALWSTCVGFETLMQSLGGKLFFSRLQYLGVAPLPVLWLLFALTFAGRHAWSRPRRFAPLFIIPALTLVLVATDASHGLVYERAALEPSLFGTNLVLEHGPWFWGVHTVYSYGALLIGFAALCRALMSAPGTYRSQYASLLVASSFPFLANVLFLGGADLLGGVDPTPLSFTLSCLVIALALLRYRLFDLMPVAQRAVFETLPVAVLVLDRQGRVVDLNPAAARLLVTPAQSAVGQRAEALVPGWDFLVERFMSDTRAHKDMQVRLGGSVRDLEVRVSELKGAAGRLAGHVVMAQDVTEQKSIERVAYYDPLTGLPNRRLLELEAENALTGARREGHRLALLYIDLDKFKPVNDRFGHEAGDVLLRQVAARLQAVSRTTDFLSRYGGDEFILFAQRISEAEARALAERIVAKLGEAFSLGGERVRIGASVGLAFYPGDAQSLDTLISRADRAMYAAKLSGDGVSIFGPDDVS